VSALEKTGGTCVRVYPIVTQVTTAEADSFVYYRYRIALKQLSMSNKNELEMNLPISL
jgi:hypothetical protein